MAMAARSKREAGRMVSVVGVGIGSIGVVAVMVLLCREWCACWKKGWYSARERIGEWGVKTEYLHTEDCRPQNSDWWECGTR